MHACILLHPFSGGYDVRVQMPLGASRLGGDPSQPQRRARSKGIDAGDPKKSRVLAVQIMTLDDEDIEAIADRVAAKLRPPTDGLVGVRDVARALGMSCGWVYRHADNLGAQRMGGGRKPALRFDLKRTLERARALGVASHAPLASTGPKRTDRPRGSALAAGVELIAPRGSRRP
jgi:hypothetical protein